MTRVACVYFKNWLKTKHKQTHAYIHSRTQTKTILIEKNIKIYTSKLSQRVNSKTKIARETEKHRANK